jgi:hypothetical protein
MKHERKKIYKEKILDPLSSWKVECTCGWKEGGMGKSAAQARFDEHQKMPHKK